MYESSNDHFRVVGTLGDYASAITVGSLKQDLVLGEDFTSSDARQGAAFIGK
jgi:hypothetical protein